MSQRSADQSQRAKLPERREREALTVEHIWAPGSDSEVSEALLVSVGRYPDGRIGEVFIDYPQQPGERRKSDRTVNLGHDVATLISIALQYGAPLEVLRAATGRAEVNRMGRVAIMPYSIIGTVLDALSREPDGSGVSGHPSHGVSGHPSPQPSPLEGRGGASPAGEGAEAP